MDARRKSTANNDDVTQITRGLDRGFTNGESGEGGRGAPADRPTGSEGDSPTVDMFFADLDDAWNAPHGPGCWNRILIYGEDHAQLIYYIVGTAIETAHAWYDLDTGRFLTGYELLH